MLPLNRFNLFFLFLIFSFNLAAQTDFREGYVITSDNDTLFGTIDYRGAVLNSRRCVFKSNNDAKQKVFSPDDILAYRFIDGKYYISQALPGEDNPSRVFLEYLINGIVDIYYYRNDLEEHYYIETSDKNLHELKNEEKEVYIDNQKYLRESMEYMGVLRYYFRDSPDALTSVDKTALDHTSLIDIAKKYHYDVCDDEVCIIYEKDHIPPTVIFGPVIGLNMVTHNAMRDFPDELQYFDAYSFDASYHPSIGAFVKISIPRLNERIFINNTVTLSIAKFIDDSYWYVEPTYDWIFDNTIYYKATILQNSLTLSYEFPQGKVRPKVYAGGFIAANLSSDFKRVLDVNYSWDSNYYTDIDTENPFNKFYTGFIAGVGINGKAFDKHHYFLNFTYQGGNVLSQNLGTHIISLELGVPFGKAHN
ncbi:MAG: hypothetical protein ACOC0C_07420 [Bacteroidota bacterium]